MGTHLSPAPFFREQKKGGKERSKETISLNSANGTKKLYVLSHINYILLLLSSKPIFLFTFFKSNTPSFQNITDMFTNSL